MFREFVRKRGEQNHLWEVSAVDELVAGYVARDAGFVMVDEWWSGRRRGSRDLVQLCTRCLGIFPTKSRHLTQEGCERLRKCLEAEGIR